MNDNTVKGLVGGIIIGALGATGLTIGTGWAIPEGPAAKMATETANDAVVDTRNRRRHGLTCGRRSQRRWTR